MLDLHPLELIPKLEQLDVSHNLLSNLNDVINILSLMQNLKNIDLRNNPITSTLRLTHLVLLKWHAAVPSEQLSTSASCRLAGIMYMSHAGNVLTGGYRLVG